MRNTFVTVTNVEVLEELRAVEDGRRAACTLDSRARPGDRVLFYVKAPVSGIAAAATVETYPNRCDEAGSPWLGHFLADVHSVVVFEKPLDRDFLLRYLPGWGWPRQPRCNAMVPAEFVRLLRRLKGVSGGDF